MRARSLSRPAVVALAASLVCAVLILPAGAQTDVNNAGGGSVFHGVPASVTSFGFGGNRGFHGVPASVTSLGFGSTGFRMHPGFGNPVFVRHGGFRRHRRGFVNPFLGSGYYVPYAYPVYVMDTGVDDSMEEDYSTGPTIFDRSGVPREPAARPVLSPDDYRSELHSKPQRDAQPVQQAAAEQPHTVLVFKDGHEQEVVNYAIVGSTLYDLSDGRTRKIALAELDLPATVKQNDRRGVDFQLPAGTKPN